MGVAGAFAVMVSVVMSLTLLPVLMKSLALKTLSLRDRKKLLGRYIKEVELTRRSFVEGSSKAVTHRPLPMLLGAVAILAVLAVPFMSMKTAAHIPGGSSPDLTQRHAYNLIVDKFGGVQSPLMVLAEGKDIAGQIKTIENLLAGLEHVSAVIPGAVDQAGDAALITVNPTGGPIDEGTKDLVENIRGEATSISAVHLEVTARIRGDHHSASSLTHHIYVLDTLIPAGPRALLSSTTRTQFPINHEEPFRP